MWYVNKRTLLLRDLFPVAVSPKDWVLTNGPERDRPRMDIDRQNKKRHQPEFNPVGVFVWVVPVNMMTR